MEEPYIFLMQFCTYRTLTTSVTTQKQFESVPIDYYQQNTCVVFLKSNSTAKLTS